MKKQLQVATLALLMAVFSSTAAMDNRKMIRKQTG